MRLRIPTVGMTEAERGHWHDWFAWCPVYVHHARTWVWLETIERRQDRDYGVWLLSEWLTVYRFRRSAV